MRSLFKASTVRRWEDRAYLAGGIGCIVCFGYLAVVRFDLLQRLPLELYAAHWRIEFGFMFATLGIIVFLFWLEDEKGFGPFDAMIRLLFLFALMSGIASAQLYWKQTYTPAPIQQELLLVQPQNVPLPKALDAP